MMKVITSAIDGAGKVVYLDGELGRGGEGSVFAVKANANAVAKIYHQSISSEKQEKIRKMVNLKSNSLLKFTTWPTDTLKDAKGQIIGFLMPRLTGKEIHKLYGPKTRLLEFPNASYSFLVHTAANMARAFATVHENGHVIGDINHGNFYVSDQATVTMLDCDSFQIGTPNRLFKCEVGIPMYQPPELQEITSFRDITRIPNHDNFGLALFIFLLLFMGRHPFAGRYLGPGEMPIEKAIKEYRFAYSSSAQGKMIQPPPGTLHMGTVPFQLAGLFERAFSTEGRRDNARPKPEEWIQALEGLSGSLQKCSHKEGHVFSRVNKSCPWCELEQKTGVVLFHAAVFTISQAISSFDLNRFWQQILSVPSPGRPSILPIPASIPTQPNAIVVERARRMKRRKLIACFPVLIGICVGIAFPNALFFIIVVTAIVTSVMYKSENNNLKQEYLKKKNEAQQRWDNISSRWNKEAGEDLFVQKMKQLEKAKQEYIGLSKQRAEKLKQLELNQHKSQLRAYLERYRIEDARIDGIGPSRKATLEAFGVETASDITTHAIRQVPGFGPTYTRKLIDWRYSIEKRFVFNPHKGIPQADIVSLDRDILSQKKRLEQEIQLGANQLMQKANQIKVRRNTLWPELELAAKELAQANTDYNAL
ncbi:hypothetical protein D7Z26_18530 [Cohnella endophytica]|uniref:Protein kinase domain-containing protein n=1 Tax=Cohnella endophytica TaxID=2419778 RepID=A0A494XJ89_9BACL|nr:hypothetical protein [Cohnella endophytica]RKP49832.1 hypothetical protein D7Z26_18530 [Cohnella endophytica]